MSLNANRITLFYRLKKEHSTIESRYWLLRARCHEIVLYIVTEYDFFCWYLTEKDVLISQCKSFTFRYGNCFVHPNIHTAEIAHSFFFLIQFPFISKNCSNMLMNENRPFLTHFHLMLRTLQCFEYKSSHFICGPMVGKRKKAPHECYY